MGHPLSKKNKNNEVLKFETKEEYFIKNGGILLEKQIALSRGQDIGTRPLKIFSSKDIQKATNCYDSDLIVGNSHRTIYKGIIDNKTVAIKIPQDFSKNPELRDLFLTEAASGTVMNHGNMAKLYGCCLEVYVPILVYELVPRGVLFDYLHGKHAAFRKYLKWGDRLRVLTDISYALSYMHNALSKPVVHRDVNSHVIVLDHSFHAKLSSNGYSISITPGETPRKWPVQGTPGYIDPEYIETQEVTDKCDVYSFGVLMLEVLTGRPPIMINGVGIDLVDVFVSAVARNCMMEMMDKEMLGEENWDEVEQVAKLALKCVGKTGIERPTMVEVVKKLWQMQGL